MKETEFDYARLGSVVIVKEPRSLILALGKYYYYYGVTPAGNTQRHYTAGELGEEERQENP